MGLSLTGWVQSWLSAAAHYGHSYTLSVNAKREKPFGHSVKILIWCASITLTHNLKKSWTQSVDDIVRVYNLF